MRHKRWNRMQLTENIKNCNGCGACDVACKARCVKMVENEEGRKYRVVDERGCNKCNACRLYCPLFNPVDLPEFTEWYEFNEEYFKIADSGFKKYMPQKLYSIILDNFSNNNFSAAFSPSYSFTFCIIKELIVSNLYPSSDSTNLK